MLKKIILKGRVQGVACRYYCGEYAQKIKIRGSATNLSDGTVRILLKTDDEKVLHRYVHALKNNPLQIRFHGRIDDIEISDYAGQMNGDYIF